MGLCWHLTARLDLRIAKKIWGGSDSVVEEFQRINNSDDSFEGHKALMAKIKAHVERNVTYDNKAEYSALVDTLKKLAENDVWINLFALYDFPT